MRNSSAWVLKCGNADVATTLSASADAENEFPNPVTLMTNVDTLIAPETPWEYINFRILAWDNYQTGWWWRDDNTTEVGIWSEADKPINNLCTTSDDCGSD